MVETAEGLAFGAERTPQEWTTLSHWVGPHPDNVVHIYIISEEIILSCFYIYYTCISGVRMTEEVE